MATDHLGFLGEVVPVQTRYKVACDNSAEYPYLVIDTDEWIVVDSDISLDGARNTAATWSAS